MPNYYTNSLPYGAAKTALHIRWRNHTLVYFSKRLRVLIMF